MTSGIALVVVVDILLAIAGLAVARSRWLGSVEGIPVWAALLMALGAIGIHMSALVGMSTLMMREMGSVPSSAIFLGIPSGVVPVLIFAYIVLASVSGGFVNFLFGSRHVPRPEEIHKARTLAMEGKIGEALALYQQMIKKYPDAPELPLAMGGVLEMNRRYSEAAQCFRGVMRKFERKPEVWAEAARRLGQMQIDFMGQPAQGERLIAEADLRLRKKGIAPPPQPKRTDNAQRDALDPGDPVEKQLVRLRQEVAAKPDSPRPLFAMALLFEQVRRYDEAADTLRRAITNFRKDDGIWSDAAYRLALLLEQYLSESEEARQLYMDIVRRTPTTKAGYLAGQRLQQLG